MTKFFVQNRPFFCTKQVFCVQFIIFYPDFYVVSYCRKLQNVCDVCTMPLVVHKKRLVSLFIIYNVSLVLMS